MRMRNILNILKLIYIELCFLFGTMFIILLLLIGIFQPETLTNQTVIGVALLSAIVSCVLDTNIVITKAGHVFGILDKNQMQAVFEGIKKDFEKGGGAAAHSFTVMFAVYFEQTYGVSLCDVIESVKANKTRPEEDKDHA